MRFLRPQTIRKLYRGVLKRNPTQAEISRFTLDFARNPDMESRLSAMIYSEEFLVMVMPDLVRAATEDFVGKKVFFLHVPKTAGTSVRLALVDALGVPSFNLYPKTTQRAPADFKTMEFWPYWAGHANIAAFPDSHTGFTTFRESRSRILSQFRQRQFNSMPGANPHVISRSSITAREERAKTVGSLDFNSWLAEEPQSALHWYIPNPTIQKSISAIDDMDSYRFKVGSDYEFRNRVFKMGEIEISRALEKSLSRFSAAGWLHQSAGIIDAIVKISGNPNASLPKENEFKKSESYKVETISRESLNILEDIRKKESILFKVATDVGILTDKLMQDEEEIFQKSAQKLGFKFP